MIESKRESSTVCYFGVFVQGHPEEDLGRRNMQEVTCSLFFLPLGLSLPKGERGELESKDPIFITDALGPKTYPVLL